MFRIIPFLRCDYGCISLDSRALHGTHCAIYQPNQYHIGNCGRKHQQGKKRVSFGITVFNGQGGLPGKQ